jgi:long-chain acyl-CoA synthetase
VVPWASLLDAEPLDLGTAAAAIAPGDTATVIYTSGTTGPPKGVVLSHYNICWTMASYLPLLQMEQLGRRIVSYLPMAHIAERMASHYLALASGYEVTTCPDPAQLAAYTREVRPELMFGVPRVWEKVHAGVQAALAADPDKAQKFEEAVAAALPLRLERIAGTITPEQQATLDFLDEIAFAPVRGLVGFDALRLALTGAAPIPVSVLEWYVAVGVPISEIYGMSENTGPLTWDPHEIKLGTVGRPMPGSEVKLAADGEVIARGGHVFQGYLDDPERTAETLDADGWLHTGDIGEMDDEGYLRIIDRKKELIITAGGKNVSPANLEAALKTIPLVGQAAAIGDRRPFMSALVVLDAEVAPAWARQQGIEFDTLADLAADERVRAEIEGDLDRVMAPFSQAERVKKIVILPDEWLPDSEELTPTSKLKRRGINTRYAAEIESLYAQA